MSDEIPAASPPGAPRVLVTGATGFVGSIVARECVKAGMRVTTTGRADLAPAQRLPNYFKADVSRPESFTDKLADVECVVHAAGLAHQFGASAKTAPFMAVNAEGAENVALCAARAGVKHFILLSSVSVYGWLDSPPSAHTAVCDETMPCRPRDLYAQSKLEGERRVIEVARRAQMPLTILRLATVYGEGDGGNVARLIRAIERQRFVWIGRGENRKSLIYNQDAARACVRVIQAGATGIDIYNVVGMAHTMREVVEEIARALNLRTPQWHVPSRLALRGARLAAALTPNGSRFRELSDTLKKWLADDVYDGGKFNQRYDFHARIELSEGIRREVAWHRQQ